MGMNGALRRMLANAAALMAIALFLAHAVAAESFLMHARGPIAAHTELSLSTSDAVATNAAHEHAEAIDPDHHAAGGTFACCGDACLTALMPGEGPSLLRAWPDRLKLAALSTLLSGRAPEGLRRPPRLSI